MTREIWSVPPDLWTGKTVVVIAGGPSLSLAQIRHVARAHLEGRCQTIAINDQVYYAWWADWVHGADTKWWMWHRLSATKFAGIKSTCCEDVPAAWAHFIPVRAPASDGSRGGMTDRQDLLAGGGNSGYQGVEIAAKAGAKRILLIGFDMQFGPNGESHAFGDHPDGMRSDYVGTMLRNWPSIVEPLKAMGISVVNCSPSAALTVFPAAKLEDVL